MYATDVDSSRFVTDYFTAQHRNYVRRVVAAVDDDSILGPVTEFVTEETVDTVCDRWNVVAFKEEFRHECTTTVWISETFGNDNRMWHSNLVQAQMFECIVEDLLLNLVVGHNIPIKLCPQLKPHCFNVDQFVTDLNAWLNGSFVFFVSILPGLRDMVSED